MATTNAKTRRFRVRLAGFMNLKIFIRDKMANTYEKSVFVIV